jgi:hypothetical protein
VVNREEAQARLVQMLMDKVRSDPYPSATQLSLIEESIPRSMLGDYVELLVEKVAQDDFPSIPMLRRISRIAESMPRDST